jgi:hypothetical protein
MKESRKGKTMLKHKLGNAPVVGAKVNRGFKFRDIRSR